MRFFFLFVVCLYFSCDVLQEVQGSVLQQDPTNSEIIAGLKEALNNGISHGSDQLSQTDGYYKSVYKILLPEDARKVTERLKIIPGFSDAEERLVEKLNRAAEDAAKGAKPIFVNAIRQMSIQDALGILMGEKDAATRYLEKTTYDPLFETFSPVIKESLDKVEALSYWEQLITAYNKIPLVQKMNPRLDDYVTEKALNGLFAMVEKEERAIRKDPVNRTTALLKKVFAKQDST
jgi:hypothetical protein